MSLGIILFEKCNFNCFGVTTYIKAFIWDWFGTEGDIVLDSTVLVVDEDNITDCGVNDDQEMIED